MCNQVKSQQQNLLSGDQSRAEAIDAAKQSERASEREDPVHASVDNGTHANLLT